MYLACMMDIDSRKIQSSVTSSTLDAHFCGEVFVEAASMFCSPEIMNADLGKQFSSVAFVAAVAASGARLSKLGKCTWTVNMFIEHFWSSSKYEDVDLRANDTVADAKRRIYRYIERCNTIRPHSS